MTRGDQITALLTAAGWADSQTEPVAGDLSARRYTRLTRRNGETAILMDAPPASDATTPAFVQMTGWLAAHGLSAPAILAQDARNGLLLLEDFGDLKISNLITQDAARTSDIYDTVIDLLLHIRDVPPPPLVRPDPKALVHMTTLAQHHYPGVDTDALQPFSSVLETVLQSLSATSPTLSLRDFHADNLMWLPDRHGIQRLGLLDYQDAFLTHPVYDLVSLLTDARTDIAPDFRADMIARYATKSGDIPADLHRAFAAFSAQRNLRILGIFARAARQHGKTAHLAKLPRVYGYFTLALSHPIFSDVREETLAAIPEPTQDLIEAIA